MRHIRIRNLQIEPPLLLAPMAGLTHSALRQIMCGFGGVGLLSTEMLSAKRLPSENPRISPFLIRTALERPLSHQLLISAVKDVAPAINALHKLDADAIDLNMGCPATTVARLGAGCMLMEQPEDVRRLVAEARRLTALPLTAKIRLGFELNEEKLKSFCTILQGEGIDMLTVHARLKDESFERRPRWEWLARVKEWAAIPVIANGGIFSVRDAEDCLRVSNADGMMLGQGAAIKPWLFAEIARDLYGSDITGPSICLPAIYGNFIDLLDELFPPERRLGRLKKFTHYFAKNYKFGHRLATRVQGSRSMDEARERAAIFFEVNEECDPGFRGTATDHSTIIHPS
ncbi:MAG TPA: tRNA-dihydrouridine synthase family protein [Dissulfurispiraceae bacterium]|nr:tRNA-dihydrouridine synthase family protein [Dissulfurispiraceae bacterium]